MSAVIRGQIGDDELPYLVDADRHLMLQCIDRLVCRDGMRVVETDQATNLTRKQTLNLITG